VFTSLRRAGIPSPARENYIGVLAQIMNANPALSVEDCLIQWMCKTGEHRYHQALACHPDRHHENQPFEIYSLLQRCRQKKTCGLLYLPLDNLCAKIRANDEMMVCKFTSTPHVPDHSRNTLNFSRVHARLITAWASTGRGPRRGGEQ